jgi:hypothetical protein
MKSREHLHPKYIRWFRYLFLVFTFGFPIWMLVAVLPGVYPNKALSTIQLLCLAPMTTIFLLVAVYYYQDVSIDDDGLLIEFLWKRLRINWADVIEVKPVWVYSFAPEKIRPVVVIVNGLTPFHRVLGVLYGLSIKQSCVITQSISDFQML